MHRLTEIWLKNYANCLVYVYVYQHTFKCLHFKWITDLADIWYQFVPFHIYNLFMTNLKIKLELTNPCPLSPINK